MTKRFWSVLMCIFALTFSFGFVKTEAAEAGETDTKEIGFSLMENWADGGDAGELKVCDLYFSRDVLMDPAMGASVGYGIIDNAAFQYLQEYFFVNGRTMSDINDDTDTSDYSFSTFPSTMGGIYAVPIVMYSDTPNHIQIRIHKQFLAEGNAGDTIKISVGAGFFADARAVNAEGDGYSLVRYELSETVTFTVDSSGRWSCDAELVPYEAPKEIIERADIDFSAIEYETIHVSDVSDIIVYDQNSKAEYMVVYFDKPVSNQYIPYASAGKKFLTNAASAGLGVTLTQAQINGPYDYRLDLSLNDYIRIDGKTIREMKAEEMINAEQRLYICWSGSSSDPRSITLYFAGGSSSWLDPSVGHTLEITEGFTTPLFGKTAVAQKLYFDPDTRTWSETDYASLKKPNYDWSPQPETEKNNGGSCSSSLVSEGGAALGCMVFAVSGTVVAVLSKKRRGESGK